MWTGAERGKGPVERRSIPHLAAAGYACRPRGYARINFNQRRAAAPDRVERPERNGPGQSVQDAHAGQAGFADLGRADEIETALRRAESARAAAQLDMTKRPCRSHEPVPAPAVAAPEIAAGLRVIDEYRCPEIRFPDAQVIDKSPKLGTGARRSLPSREKPALRIKWQGR